MNFSSQFYLLIVIAALLCSCANMKSHSGRHSDADVRDLFNRALVDCRKSKSDPTAAISLSASRYWLPESVETIIAQGTNALPVLGAYSQPWQRNIQRLQQALELGLAPARDLDQVADVRCLGGIGVIELREPVDLKQIQPLFVERGVWIRPFGKLVYTMPPFIMSDTDIATLTHAMVDVVASLQATTAGAR